ncbi:UNKNOWN [Stylonychia lemnae]|uniref:Uncharacterized protein n=1 Tax=Stylonychia lemnae TaxID=5949 RepID=A0A078AKG7_STYLE|nr:UNKNOWN [Stylonychia lemnae]|eukprot:CDW81917.1 UNKNOWN [Stylonychia lemnae]
MSMVLGSLIAAFISANLKQTTFLLIMAAIASLSIAVFATLTKPINYKRYLPEDSDQDFQSVVAEKLKQQSSEMIKVLLQFYQEKKYQRYYCSLRLKR